ncbi:transcription factor, putative [Ricinus communis]|uniref:Transcription factor, putative n=2 Tax=Ricinus communis TaxID=3988 RepID=B9SKZ0_RICCO|nr:transcription factor, putative [Ricinus communis]
MDVHADVCQFSSSFSTGDDTTSDISSIPCLSTLFPNGFAQSPACTDNQLQALSVEDFLLDNEGFDPNLNGDMEFLYGQFCESEDSFPFSNEGKELWSPSSPSTKFSEAASAESTSIQPSLLVFPGEESELDNRLTVLHLLKAYGEAMENQKTELAGVLIRCLREKVSLAGEPLLRIAFSLSQDTEKHGDYLKQESSNNFEAAFRAFYQIFPNGRIAHFAANSAILEAMPADAEMIHIVDFDMGEGVQWPPMLETLARLQKGVRLTAIKWEQENCDEAPLMWSFSEAKRRLVDHARPFGLKLKVEEMGIEDLVSEIKRTKKRGGRKEWLAFNCMVGLPHMGRVRSRKLVEDFVRVAKDLMADSVCCNSSNRGILTFGDGDAWETVRDCSGFASYFEGNLMHYQALLESIEMNFPIHLAEARMALECLFVTPFISSQAWIQRWMEMKECCNLQMGTSLEGWRVSNESLEEARETVKEKQSLYKVRIGGEWNNEMILEWRGTQLVRVSAWRN